MILAMQLTDEEIKEIADRMDDLMWEGFHDIVDDVYRQREDSSYDYEIWDEDIIKVRKELKKYI
tara:strand:+ start:232 stop:423 length:192 start_codon:yes stop_codon:yes gene_type:complete